MALSRTVRIGVGLLLFGIAAPAAWTLWDATRNWVPLDTPVSLARGHVRTAPFTINVESTYAIQLVVQRSFDFDGVPCMIGYACEGSNSIVRLGWSLSDGRSPLAAGNSDTEQGLTGGIKTMARDLGSVRASKGRYFLDLDVLQDGSRLNPGAPRLVIAESGSAHADSDAQGFRVFAMSLLSAAAGLFLIVRQAIVRKRERPLHNNGKGFAPPLSSAWTGAFLALAALVVYGSVHYWMATRRFVAVEMPVSLGVGHIRTGPFQINLSGSYNILIDVDNSQPYNQDCQVYRILKTRWVLYRGPQVVASAVAPVSPAHQQSFDATTGTYNLDVEVLQDASCLNASHPELRIDTDPVFYADLASALLWLCVVSGGVGVSLLLIACGRNWQSRPSPVAPPGQSPVFLGHLAWKVRVSKRPFRGMPSFGLVGGSTFLSLFLATQVLQIIRNPVPVGLLVRTVRPGLQAISIPGIQPLLVRIESAGPGAPPNLYLNAQPVSWEEFDPRLQKELARRPPNWPVYLDGDPALEVAWPMKVIDRIRGLHAEVALVTGRRHSPH